MAAFGALLPNGEADHEHDIKTKRRSRTSADTAALLDVCEEDNGVRPILLERNRTNGLKRRARTRLSRLREQFDGEGEVVANFAVSSSLAAPSAKDVALLLPRRPYGSSKAEGACMASGREQVGASGGRRAGRPGHRVRMCRRRGAEDQSWEREGKSSDDVATSAGMTW